MGVVLGVLVCCVCLLGVKCVGGFWSLEWGDWGLQWWWQIGSRNPNFSNCFCEGNWMALGDLWVFLPFLLRGHNAQFSEVLGEGFHRISNEQLITCVQPFCDRMEASVWWGFVRVPVTQIKDDARDSFAPEDLQFFLVVSPVGSGFFGHLFVLI